MGRGMVIRCPKCGFKFDVNLGVGFAAPSFYSELVSDMKRGKLGKQGKRFFQEHPNGAIDINQTVAECSKCHQWTTVIDLTMYVPKDESAQSEEFVSPWELKEDYKEYAKYNHKCKHCHGPAHVITDFEEKAENGDLRCPCCGEKLQGEVDLMWD